MFLSLSPRSVPRWTSHVLLVLISRQTTGLISKGNAEIAPCNVRKFTCTIVCPNSAQGQKAFIYL